MQIDLCLYICNVCRIQFYPLPTRSLSIDSYIMPVCKHNDYILSLFTNSPNMQCERDRMKRGGRITELIKATVERVENSV